MNTVYQLGLLLAERWIMFLAGDFQLPRDFQRFQQAFSAVWENTALWETAGKNDRYEEAFDRGKKNCVKCSEMTVTSLPTGKELVYTVCPVTENPLIQLSQLLRTKTAWKRVIFYCGCYKFSFCNILPSITLQNSSYSNHWIWRGSLCATGCFKCSCCLISELLHSSTHSTFQKSWLTLNKLIHQKGYVLRKLPVMLTVFKVSWSFIMFSKCQHKKHYLYCSWNVFFVFLS